MTVYRTEVFVADEPEDTVACIVGECPKCKVGQNNLIIFSRFPHPNLREKQRGNEMMRLFCIVCKTNLIKTKFDLTEGN